MKKFAAFLMILTVSVFTIGCGEGEEKPAADPPAAGEGTGGGTEGSGTDTGTEGEGAGTGTEGEGADAPPAE